MWETATVLTGTNSIVFEQDSGNKITLALSGLTVNPVPVSGTNIDGTNTGSFVWTATGVSITAIDDIANW